MLHVLERLIKARQELELILGNGSYQATEFEKIILDKEIKELMKLQKKMLMDSYEQYV